MWIPWPIILEHVRETHVPSIIWFKSLALQMYPDTPEWIHDILNSVSSIKGVSNIIIEYNYIFTHAIDALERCISRI